MKLLTQEVKNRLPKLYSQDGKPADQVKVIVKFFDPTGSWTWYATEGEQTPEGDWRFFGLVRGFEAELGYFHLSELIHAKEGLRGMRGLPIERDMHFNGHTLAEVQEQRL